MAVPILDELHRPVLEIANASAKRLTRKEFLERLTVVFSLTDTDLQEMVPSGGQSRMENRTNWAMTDLKKAGMINNPQRNQWEITQTGRDLLANQQGIIKLVDLQKLWPESQESTAVPATNTLGSVDITPDEQMAKSHAQHQNMLSDEILDSVKGVTPSGFEHLVVELLSRMGYGDGRVVGHSGDQGIDGFLNQDTLGLEKVYVQAKRHTSSQVGEPDIRNFSGSLVAQGATKGVFITTSTFSLTARQTAQAISLGNQFIRLIDGSELAELMIKHGVGVVTEMTYEVKKLDANYFADF